MKTFVQISSVVLLSMTLASAAFSQSWDQAVEYFENGQYSEAFSELTPLAEEGNANAQFNLGIMYNTGQGVAQNYTEAMKWYRLAAEQGNANAQLNLGIMYYNGQGVAQNYTEAMKWYRLAAEQGNARAQNNLGSMYRTGQGVAQNYVLAHMWYNISASQGTEISAKNRDLLAKQMTAADLSVAQAKASACLASNYANCD